MQANLIAYRPEVPATKPESTLDWARNYIEQGFAVLLLAPRSKAPLAGSKGWHDGTRDISTVESILEQVPNANMAIVPALSDVVVLDFDYRHAGDRLLTEVMREHGLTNLSTPTCLTPGGQHLYYRDDGTNIGRRLCLPDQCGVDILGSHDYAKKLYAVAPCSIHPGGEPYRWMEGQAPGELPLKTFPMEVLDTLERYFRTTDIQATPGVLQALNAPEAASQQPKHSKLSGHYSYDETSSAEYDRDPRFVAAVCELLKIPFELGKPFCSPLRADGHPSASLYLDKDGYYKYHDFTRSGRYWSLVQVYAAKSIGHTAPLPSQKGAALPLWRTRLLLELGWDEVPVAVSLAPLPSGIPNAAAVAYWGFFLALQCHAVLHKCLVPVPYTFGFCSMWTGLNMNDAEAGVRWLRRNGFMKKVDTITPERGRAYGRFLPGDTSTISASEESSTEYPGVV